MRTEARKRTQRNYASSEKGRIAHGRANRKYDLSIGIKALKDIHRCPKCNSNMLFLIEELDIRETMLECLSCGWTKYALTNAIERVYY